MSFTVFPHDGGEKRELSRLKESDQQITPEQLEDVPRMQRLWMRVLRDLSRLLSLWTPDVIEHEDVPFDGTGTTTYALNHNLGGRVRFWAVDWVSGSGGGPALARHSDTTDNVLVLVSYIDGVGTIRIERAG